MNHLLGGADGGITTIQGFGVNDAGIPNNETAMDIELAIAMAPGLSQVDVFVSPDSCDFLETLLNAMLPTEFDGGLPDGAIPINQLATSYVCYPSYWNQTTVQLIEQMTTGGQSFFVPSGDRGGYPTYFGAHFGQAPVTTVGGTDLTMNDGGLSYQSESPWSDGDGASGGGFEYDFPQPDYQANAGIDWTLNQGSALYANDPDVSLVAQDIFAVGHWVNAIPGAWLSYYGTSCAVPLWAGLSALANEQNAANALPPLGFINRAIYAIGASSVYSSSFHDIATGFTASTMGGPNYPAVLGFDLATGWGTPRCGLIDQLACVACNGSAPAKGSPPSCVSFQSDPNSCGRCGQACSVGQICVQGLCQVVTRSAAAIAAGGLHTCAITADGIVLCWGMNDFGELGNGSRASSSVPVPVPYLVPGTIPILQGAIAAGGSHTCVLTDAGGILCWGSNQYGELGNGATACGTVPPGQQPPSGCVNNLINPVPVRVINLGSGSVAVSAGGHHSCAIIGSGIQCWGANDEGQLGDGSTDSLSSVPVSVAGIGPGAVAIAAGGYHTCAIDAGGGVQCWGANEFGQLGSGSTVSGRVPIQVVTSSGSGALTGVQAITAGWDHTCAVLSGGGVQCWGSNDVGQLGNGTYGIVNPVPVDVVSLNLGVIAITAPIAADDKHTCAVTTAGGVQCWGSNFRGELGTDSSVTFFSMVPVGVSTLGSGPWLSPLEAASRARWRQVVRLNAGATTQRGSLETAPRSTVGYLRWCRAFSWRWGRTCAKGSS